MALTPLAQVKKSFNSRAELVAKLTEMVDRQHGDDSSEKVRARLFGLTNQKLLRLYRVEQKVRERFGDRKKMVAFIVAERKKAGYTTDASFMHTVETATKARLLDLTRQNFPEKPTKLTPQQRLASKHGKKQLARARAKIG